MRGVGRTVNRANAVPDIKREGNNIEAELSS